HQSFCASQSKDRSPGLCGDSAAVSAASEITRQFLGAITRGSDYFGPTAPATGIAALDTMERSTSADDSTYRVKCKSIGVTSNGIFSRGESGPIWWVSIKLTLSFHAFTLILDPIGRAPNCCKLAGARAGAN